MTDCEKFYQIYNAKKARSVPYSELEVLLNIDVLSVVGKDEKFSITQLASRLGFSGIEHYGFYQKLARCKNCFSHQQLLDLWGRLISDRGSVDFQTLYLPCDNESCPNVVIKNHYVKERWEYGCRTIYIRSKIDDSDVKYLDKYGLTDELLIDNPAVVFRYCQLEKPGWEMLRYLGKHPRRTARQRIPEKMRQAIETDNKEVFMIYKDLAGVKYSYSLIAEIMASGAKNIFAEIVKSKELFKQRSITLPELAVYCTLAFEDAVSVPFLQSIEEVYPGELKNVRDHWNRNLLWYAVHNQKTAFFHPFCKLTEFLLQAGCDPDNQNQLGIPWRYMMKNLPLAKKESWLKRRHGKRNFNAPSALSHEQPVCALLDKTLTTDWMKNL